MAVFNIMRAAKQSSRFLLTDSNDAQIVADYLDDLEKLAACEVRSPECKKDYGSLDSFTLSVIGKTLEKAFPLERNDTLERLAEALDDDPTVWVN